MLEPLVSIVVVTYYSSQFLQETLDSIKEQTYKNIEFIISDDCSKDDTIKICEEWLKENRCRFTNCQILTSLKNTGVVANCNRGYQASTGMWIKDVAGDDALYPEAIEKFIQFTIKNPQARIIHSRMHMYYNTLLSSNMEHKHLKLSKYLMDNQFVNPQKQFNLLCLVNEIGAVTVFMQRALYLDLGGFDEQIPMCEDWPMWLKTTKQGYPIYFLDDYTSKYRITTSSIMGKENKNYLFKRFYQTENHIYNKYIKKYARIDTKFFNRYDFYVRLSLEKIGLNKKNYFSKLIYYTLIFPFKIYYKALY